MILQTLSHLDDILMIFMAWIFYVHYNNNILKINVFHILD